MLLCIWRHSPFFWNGDRKDLAWVGMGLAVPADLWDVERGKSRCIDKTTPWGLMESAGGIVGDASCI